jgi:hypothetical protein
MAWQSFEVRSAAMAVAVADQLQRQFGLALAIGLPLCARVAVLRRDRGDSVQFFFSAEAVELFRTLVQFHGGKPCRAPRSGCRPVRYSTDQAGAGRAAA